MQRWLTYIAGLLLCLLWTTQTGWLSRSADGTDEQSMAAVELWQPIGGLDSQSGTLSPQNEELGRLIMQSLHGDRVPNTYAQQTGRIVLPVMRLNPHIKMTFGLGTRMSEPVALQRDRVQRKSEARIRAALDESGYYVFALRKIII